MSVVFHLLSTDVLGRASETGSPCPSYCSLNRTTDYLGSLSKKRHDSGWNKLNNNERKVPVLRELIFL